MVFPYRKFTTNKLSLQENWREKKQEKATISGGYDPGSGR